MSVELGKDETFDACTVALLEEGGFGVYNDTIFKGSKARIPDGPGPFISVIPTGGGQPEGTHNATLGPGYINPSAQLLFRGTDYDDTMFLACRVRNFLFAVKNRFVNEVWWRQTRIHQDPFDLQKPDDKGRVRIAFNFDAVMRPSAAASVP